MEEEEGVKSQYTTKTTEWHSRFLNACNITNIEIWSTTSPSLSNFLKMLDPI